MVRELIGPLAAFRLSAAVRGLPRTRSGKTSRKSIADLARNKFVKVRTRSVSLSNAEIESTYFRCQAVDVTYVETASNRFDQTFIIEGLSIWAQYDLVWSGLVADSRNYRRPDRVQGNQNGVAETRLRANRTRPRVTFGDVLAIREHCDVKYCN